MEQQIYEAEVRYQFSTERIILIPMLIFVFFLSAAFFRQRLAISPFIAGAILLYFSADSIYRLERAKHRRLLLTNEFVQVYYLKKRTDQTRILTIPLEQLAGLSVSGGDSVVLDTLNGEITVHDVVHAGQFVFMAKEQLEKYWNPKKRALPDGVGASAALNAPKRERPEGLTAYLGLPDPEEWGEQDNADAE